MSARAGLLAAVAVVLVAGAAALYAGAGLDPGGLLDRLQDAPPWMLLLVLLTLPLAGMPLSALLVVVGAAWPLLPALAAAFAVLLVHHLLILLLSRTALYTRLRDALARRGLLPEHRQQRRLGDDLLFILAATWVPGLSYIFKVALTALAGIPLRTYLIAGVPSQTVAAAPYLVLGHVAGSADLGWIGATVFAIVAVSWLIKRFVFTSTGRTERP